MEIDGQVTISLKTFNQLQDRAKQADELKKKMQDLQYKRRSQTLLIRSTNRKRNRYFVKLMITI